MPLVRLLALLILGFSQPIRAQLFDDFSDGNFTANPAWSGDGAAFKINSSGQLQLAAPAAGRAQLLTATEVADSAVWRFWLRLDFAPSAANRLRVWLQSDAENLATASGYFLEIGETGTADALRFFRSDAGQTKLIAAGPAATVAAEPVLARLEVRRKKGGLWQIAADFAGNEAFSPQIEATDHFHAGGAGLFFGFECTFTGTRTEHFFFDEIDVRPDWPDLAPPVLLRAEAVGGVSVAAFFDEKIDPASLDADRFSLTPGIGKAVGLGLILSNERAVRLDFSQPMTDGQTYFLTAKAVADPVGNVAAEQSASFVFERKSHPKPADLLVSEIMADPSPTAGLPEVEWLEIQNRSTQLIDFQGVTLEIGATKKALPNFLLPAGGFVLVADEADLPLFSTSIKKVGLPNFPALPNTFGTVRLADSTGQTVDFVAYDLDFYQNPAKAEGGWSLERRWPERPCATGAAAWGACEAVPGGSPGAANTVFSGETDAAGPILLGAFARSATEIQLVFDEAVDEKAATDPARFRLEPPLDFAAFRMENAARRSVVAELLEPLEAGQIYQIFVDEKLVDCAGREAEKGQSAAIALGEQAEANSLIINELLFDPLADGADFVEILNTSNRPILLPGLLFECGGEARKIEVERVLFPSEKAVFSTSSPKTERDFFVENPVWLHENLLPALPDGGGRLRLLRSDGLEIDALDFSPSRHNALLKTEEKDGRSLERVSPKKPSSEPSNWASAADQPALGAGTPTATNSQNFDSQSVENEWFSSSPSVISPDGDGQNDFLQIEAALPSAGFVGKAQIFSERGFLVKIIADEQLFGASATLRWDGDRADGSPAATGIYLVRAEFVDAATGRVLRARRAFGLVQK